MRSVPSVLLRASLVLALVVVADTALGQPDDSAVLRRSVDPANPAGALGAGSPPGSGAGTTGFISIHTPRAVESTADAEDVTGAVPERPARRPLEEDPYGPVGIRAGSFDVLPSVELYAGHDDNPFRTSGGRGSRFGRIDARVETQSNWSRHELQGLLRGAFTRYFDVDHNDRPEAEARLRGRIDVTGRSRIELEGRAALTTEAAGSPDAVTAAKRPPNIYSFGGTAGFVQQFNRFELGLHGDIERNTYESARLIAGGTLDLSDRNYTSYGMRLRGGYEVTPGIRPFAETGIDRRVFDRRVDSSGQRTGSDGVLVRAGVAFGREQVLTGEASIGYARRRYRDPNLDDISALIVDSSLVWTASALTTVTLSASSDIGETRLAGSSGVLTRQASITVDHAFRRWLIGSLGASYEVDDYRGVGRRDKLLGLSVAVTYHLNRYAALKGEVRHERLRSNAPGADYTANIVFFGLRLQR